jgi:hypothetical protein
MIWLRRKFRQWHYRRLLAAWPPVGSRVLRFNWRELTLDGMRWGASLGSVAIWGRPEHIALPADHLLQITYPERGLALEFEDESLSYIGFEFSPDHPGRRLPVDHLHAEMPFFSAATLLADVRRVVGAPERTERDASETVLLYRRRQLVLEFEFDRAGALRRFNLFPGAGGLV